MSKLARISTIIRPEFQSIPSTLGSPDYRKPGGWAKRASWLPTDGICGTCGRPATVEPYQSTIAGVTTLKRVVRCQGEKKEVRGCRYVTSLNACPVIIEKVESEEDMPKMSAEWGEAILESARVAGLTMEDVVDATGLAPSTVKNGIAGRNCLSEAAVAKIEAAVGPDFIERKLHPDFIARADILMRRHGWTVSELAGWVPRPSNIKPLSAATIQKALDRQCLADTQLNTIEVGICELEARPDSHFQLVETDDWTCEVCKVVVHGLATHVCVPHQTDPLMRPASPDSGDAATLIDDITGLPRAAIRQHDGRITEAESHCHNSTSVGALADQMCHTVGRLSAVEEEINELAKSVTNIVDCVDDHQDRLASLFNDLESSTMDKTRVSDSPAQADARWQHIQGQWMSVEEHLSQIESKIASLAKVHDDRLNALEAIPDDHDPSIPPSRFTSRFLGISTIFDLLCQMSEEQQDAMLSAAAAYRRMAEQFPAMAS